MNTSGIEWTDRTWNPVSGCSHVSEGCRNCYAERLFPRPYPGRKFTDVRCHPERLDQPLKIKKPQKIFVNSMSDLFHEDVSFEFIDKVFAVMGLAPRHTFQVLTKRPERMLQYLTASRETVLHGSHASGKTQWHIWSAACGLHGSNVLPWSWNSDRSEIIGPWPLPNVWLGVSIENQQTADERIPLLLATPAAVRFVSCEPLLGAVDLTDITWPSDHVRFPVSDDISESFDALRYTYYSGNDLVGGHVDWVIVGGESGPKARPMDPDWARSVRDQCVAAGVPFFFKQWGEWWLIARADGIHEMPIGCFNTGTRFGFIKKSKHEAGHLLDGKAWQEFPGKEPG